MRVASDYLCSKVSCCLIRRFLFVYSLQVHFARTARRMAWSQKLLPDLKDKQASNCETGRGGKSSSAIVTHTHIHTGSHKGCAWMPIGDGAVEPRQCIWLLLSLSLHTGVPAETLTKKRKYSFIKNLLMSSGCPLYCSPTTHGNFFLFSFAIVIFFLVYKHMIYMCIY